MNIVLKENCANRREAMRCVVHETANEDIMLELEEIGVGSTKMRISKLEFRKLIYAGHAFLLEEGE